MKKFFVIFLIGLLAGIRDDTRAVQVLKNAKHLDTTAYPEMIRKEEVPFQSEEIIESLPHIDKSQTDVRIEQSQNNQSHNNVKSNKKESPATQLVSTPVQTHNLLEQGYSVKQIAKEMGLAKKEVRKLKRNKRREERSEKLKRKKANSKKVSNNK